MKKSAQILRGFSPSFRLWRIIIRRKPIIILA
jgi:hypothetical protein